MARRAVARLPAALLGAQALVAENACAHVGDIGARRVATEDAKPLLRLSNAAGSNPGHASRADLDIDRE